MPGHAFVLKRRYLQVLRARRRSRGAILLLVMFLIALMGILLSMAGPVWHAAMLRDKEADLLWMGDEYARAIAGFHAATPAGEYPRQLEQLLLDMRQPNTTRHLRRLYRDPMTGRVEWGLIKDASGRITGVYSLGAGVPLKQGGFEKRSARFKDAKSYADWTFVPELGGVAPVTAAVDAQLPAPKVPVFNNR